MGSARAAIQAVTRSATAMRRETERQTAALKSNRRPWA